ncbi:hypothetical protein ACSSS7_003011 [Eimeria intestinalis]
MLPVILMPRSTQEKDSKTCAIPPVAETSIAARAAQGPRSAAAALQQQQQQQQQQRQRQQQQQQQEQLDN